MMDTGFHDIISSMNSSTNLSTSNSSDEKLRAENRNLKAEIESLKKQTGWDCSSMIVFPWKPSPYLARKPND